jgi:RNA polymerase sigma factor (sigma-70 family)
MHPGRQAASQTCMKVTPIQISLLNLSQPKLTCIMAMGKLSHLFAVEAPIRVDESEIIESIRLNDQKVIATLYYQNQMKVKKMVWAFKNLILDPDDIYQEGFSFAVFNVQEGKFRSESSFSTYLVSICRNLCLKQLSKSATVELSEKYDPIEEVQEYDLLNQLIQFKQQLGDKCREVIDLRFTMGEVINEETPNKCLSFDEIAEQLDITTVSARQRFKRCLDKLRELVMESPELKHYLS